MVSAFITVFSQLKNVFFASSVALIIFLGVVWIPNWELILFTTQLESTTALHTIQLLISLLGSIGTNFTTVAAMLVIVIAVLFGINITLLVYYLRTIQISGIRSASSAGIGGLISGLFGIGCAACGTLVFSSFLASVGATAVLLYLPLHGAEVGFLGVLLLLYSTYRLLQKIAAGGVCPV